MRTKIKRQGFKGRLAALLAVPIIATASSALAQCPPRFTEDFDGVTPPVLPAGWVASQGVNVTGAPLWVTSNVASHTSPNDAFSTAPDNILDNRLDTPLFNADPFAHTISFQNNYNLESGRDGAVLEISSPNINGGAFTDITDPAVGGSFSTGGYDTVISNAFQSPIGGRMAWSGNSGGYILTRAFLGNAAFPPSQIRVRFRLASDNSGASVGWRIDTFSHLSDECPSPTPSFTVTPSATPTPTATIFPTPTPTPSDCPGGGGICPSPTPSPPATPTPSPTPTATPSLIPAQALNISTRLRVETGDRVMIGGFIITGNEPKKVAIRGIGPSLANFGLSDLLADPTLELRGSDSALLVQNDNWQDDPASAGELTDLGLALQDSNESGIVATLSPGAYTAILAGNNQTTGIGLVEIYDADLAAASQLANISTRGFVRTGDNVMIGGFILGNGGGSATVAVRGIGPSLGQLGLSNVLADPTLELRDGNGALLIANDNWQEDPVAAAQLADQGLAPQDSLESGIFATVAPGLFTAILAGKDGGIGLGLLEVYSNVHPHTIIVTSTSNNGPGTLDQALADAQSGDVIQFDPSLYGRTITLNGSGLRIDTDIVVSGPGPNQLSVQLSGLSLSVFEISSGHTVILEGLTIRGGHARVAGGGIRTDGSTLTVNHCVIGPNMSDGSGGGIYNGSGGRLTVLNSVVSQNSTTGMLNSYGGGIYNALGSAEIRNSIVSDNHAANTLVVSGLGGGIANSGTMTITNSTVRGNFGAAGAGIGSLGPLTITNSTISGNMGIFGASAPSAGGGVTNNNALMSISNSTVSGNSAHEGGGIFNNTGTMIIANTTISDNGTGENAGSIQNTGGLQIANTILKAGSSGATIFSPSGFVTSGGYNLSSDNGGGFLTATGDQINTDPMLGPLQNNGGSTFTHALLLGSPAINAGDPNFVPPPFSDQRGPGYDRVSLGRIDIGSFELQP